MKNTFKNILFICGLMMILVLSASAQTTQYVYDENGRLKAVIAPSGETAVYEYDTAGNIVSVTRQNTPIVSVNSISLINLECETKLVINGTGFIADTAQNAVTFDNQPATIESATLNEIVVLLPVGFNAQNVRITNAYGTVERPLNLDLSVLRFPIDANVPSQRFNITEAGQTISLCYEGTANKNISMLLTNVVFSSLNIKIISPTGNIINTQNYLTSDGQIFIDRKSLTETGKYSIELNSSENQTGSMDVSLFEFEDFSAELMPDGTPLNVTTTKPGQNAELQFSSLGFSYKLTVQDSTINNYTVSLFRRSDGQFIRFLTSSNGAIISDPTGDYTIGFDPIDTETGTAVFKLEPLTIQTDGTPVTVDLYTENLNAGLTFSATTGQSFTLQVSNVTAHPSFVNVRDPNGNVLASSFIDIYYSGAFLQFTAPTDGIYVVEFDPLGNTTGSATFSLTLLNELTGTLVINDPAKTFTSTQAGQPFRLTVAGNQGQRFNLKAVTQDFYTLALTITKPSGGTLLTLGNFGQDTVIDVNNLPETGDYIIYLQPNFPNQSGNLTLRAIDNNVFISNTEFEYLHAYFYSVIQGGLQGNVKTEKNNTAKPKDGKSETPQTENFGVPSASYFYEGMIDEVFSFSPNQIQSTFSFTSGTMTLYLPDGSVLASAPIGSGICNITLPESGTYRIEVSPESDTEDLVFVKICGGPGSQ